MDLEKELVPKILHYSKIRNKFNQLQGFAIWSILNHKNRQNDWFFIPHLPIIREIRVRILEDKFYNAILISTRYTEYRWNFFFFFFISIVLSWSRVKEKKTILLALFLKATHLEAILLRWSYMIIRSLYFPLVSFSLPYYHERHAWTVKIRCKKL